MVTAVLIGAAGSLVVLDALFEEPRMDAPHPPAPAHLDAVEAAVDTLLQRYDIQSKWVRSWQVLTPDGRFIRHERRVLVPPEFPTLSFNHDLHRAVSALGANAVATERTKQGIVTVHVRKGRTIVMSISLVTDPRLSRQSPS